MTNEAYEEAVETEYCMTPNVDCPCSITAQPVGLRLGISDRRHFDSNQIKRRLRTMNNTKAKLGTCESTWSELFGIPIGPKGGFF